MPAITASYFCHFRRAAGSKLLGNASGIPIPIFPRNLEERLDIVYPDLHPGKPRNNVCRQAFGLTAM
jgi:hypothetical protein